MVLEKDLYMKGCLVMVSHTSRYSFPWCEKVGGEVLPQAIRDVMGKHRLYWLGHLVLCSNNTSIYVICNVSVCGTTIGGCTDEELHLLSALVPLCRPARVLLYHSGRIHTQSPFRSIQSVAVWGDFLFRRGIG